MPDSDFHTPTPEEKPSWSDPECQFLLDRTVTFLEERALYMNALKTLADRGYYLLQFTYTGQASLLRHMQYMFKWTGDSLSGTALELEELLLAEPFNSADRAAICISGFDQMLMDNPTFSNDLLDAIEHAAREYMLFGKMLLGVMQKSAPVPQKPCEIYGRRLT